MDEKSKHRFFFYSFAVKRHLLLPRLDRLVEGTGDNVLLLLGSKLDEVYCVSGHADGQLGIVLRMLLSISKHISL